MSKFRYLDTKFWDDDYIASLNPIEKFLFLYFITNPLTNIAGIYEITLKRMTFDTGLIADDILKMVEKFSKDKKIYYLENHIIVCNFPKYQNYKDSPQIKTGIETILGNLPPKLLESIYTLSIPYLYPSRYLNRNSNLNRDAVQALFTFWNELKVVTHKACTDKMKTKLNSALKEYSEADIRRAMENYAKVVLGEEYFWKFKWTIEEFLSRGLTRFLETPIENFLKDKSNQVKAGNLLR